MRLYLFAVLTLVLLAANSMAAKPTEANHYLIEVASGGALEIEARVQAAGGELLRMHAEIGYAYATSDDPRFARRLARTRGVKRVDHDSPVQWIPEPDPAAFVTSAVPVPAGQLTVDPTTASYFPCQWNLHQIDAPGAWALGEFGHPDVKVAVLDTGIDPAHQDIANSVDLANSVSMLGAPSACETFFGVDDVGTINDYHFHGTFVSGLVAAEGLVIAGVAPRTRIVSVKVLNCLGAGTFGDMIAGILYAASLPDVDVINISAGSYLPRKATGVGPLLKALNEALEHASSMGKLVVASAGNEFADLDHDRNFIRLPAEARGAIGVWAGDINGALARYSNHGRSGTWVGAGGGDMTLQSPHLPIPGCRIPEIVQNRVVSACASDSVRFPCGSGAVYLASQGTSFSTPLVSGVAALIDGMYGGSRNAAQLKKILRKTADDLGRRGVDNLFSRGRVNAAAAVYP